MKIVKQFQPKIVIFTALKNCCMMHGCVFVKFSGLITWLGKRDLIFLLVFNNYCNFLVSVRRGFLFLLLPTSRLCYVILL